jgi:uncharacterized protein (DUF736 family)
MSDDKSKPNFRANNSEVPVKKPQRKELAVVWEKETTTGEKYLNIKVNLPDGKEMWLKAFKNKLKKEGDITRPEYVAWENKKEE